MVFQDYALFPRLNVADNVGFGLAESGTRAERIAELLDCDIAAASGAPCDPCMRRCKVDVLIRPDDIVHDDASLLLAEVVHKAFRGAEFRYTLKLPSGARALSLVPSHHDHALGEKIGIKLAVDHVVAFPRP